MSENECSAYLISLLRSLLEEQPAPALPDNCSPAELLKLSERHCVAEMAYYALEKLPLTDLETDVKWRQIRDKSLISDLSQQMDLEVTGRSFREAGIRFMPFGGSAVKSMYPRTDMRTMSGTDILIDPENDEKARKVMTDLGYTCEVTDDTVTCRKPAGMDVVLHHALFSGEHSVFRQIFSDPWAGCTADNLWYSLSPDVLTAYIMAQAVIQLENGCADIQTILDLWVCLHPERDSELKRSCEILAPSGKINTAKLMVKLSEVWFGGRAHSEATLQLEQQILGTAATVLAVIPAAREPAFPTLAQMQEYYPVLKKAPALLPLFWLVRLLTKPFSCHHSD